MKATLKHVANQYILIVDERPKQNEWWYHQNGVINNINNELNDPDYNDCCRIIAAESLDGVKGIGFKDKEYILNNIPKHIRFKNDETTWKEYLEQYIDTEVEVTKEEDYWLVRL